MCVCVCVWMDLNNYLYEIILNDISTDSNRCWLFYSSSFVPD